MRKIRIGSERRRQLKRYLGDYENYNALQTTGAHLSCMFSMRWFCCLNVLWFKNLTPVISVTNCRLLRTVACNELSIAVDIKSIYQINWCAVENLLLSVVLKWTMPLNIPKSIIRTFPGWTTYRVLIFFLYFRSSSPYALRSILKEVTGEEKGAFRLK